jgi:hypothetical protein
MPDAQQSTFATRRIAFFSALLLGLAAATAAYAGAITGKATEAFARVIIVTCNQSNVDACSPVHDGPMAKGDTVVSNTGHLCYKRENRPGDASSGMASSWKCDTNTLDSPENFDIS